MPTPTSTHPLAARHAREGLTSPSFLGLLVTQFLGALNDNMYRWLVVPIAKELLGPQSEALALSAGLACLVLPFIVLAAPAGYLADRFSKRQVLVGCKLAEIAIMSLGVGAIALESPWAMFGVLLLMGSQSALFGPAKYGCLPEMLSAGKLPAANGLIGMSTIVAVIVGTQAGLGLYAVTSPAGGLGLWLPALALIGVAGAGTLSSLWIAGAPAADPHRPLPTNPLREAYRDVLQLRATPGLATVAVGIAFFWSLASLAQLNVDAYGIECLGLSQSQVGLLVGALAIGVALGNVLAGLASRGRIELGLVPLGAVGLVASAAALYFTTGSTVASVAALLGLGISSGFFDVPLQAQLQHTSQASTRGRVLAASNFLTFSATLGAAGLFWLLRGPLHLSAGVVFLLAAGLTLPVLGYSLARLAGPVISLMVSAVVRRVYRLRVEGLERLGPAGGALLVPNHVSWIDAVLLMVVSPRPIRMVAYADYVEGGLKGWLARQFGAIPIKAGSGSKSIARSILAVRQALEAGELVCVFPEGGITRDGQLQPFQPGYQSMVKHTGAPIIPVHLGGLWESIFSYRAGRAFWKMPSAWPLEVAIRFGRPIAGPIEPELLRQAVLALASPAPPAPIKRPSDTERPALGWVG